MTPAHKNMCLEQAEPYLFQRKAIHSKMYCLGVLASNFAAKSTLNNVDRHTSACWCVRVCSRVSECLTHKLATEKKQLSVHNDMWSEHSIGSFHVAYHQSTTQSTATHLHYLLALTTYGFSFDQGHAQLLLHLVVLQIGHP